MASFRIQKCFILSILYQFLSNVFFTDENVSLQPFEMKHLSDVRMPNGKASIKLQKSTSDTVFEKELEGFQK